MKWDNTSLYNNDDDDDKKKKHQQIIYDNQWLEREAPTTNFGSHTFFGKNQTEEEYIFSIHLFLKLKGTVEETNGRQSSTQWKGG